MFVCTMSMCMYIYVWVGMCTYLKTCPTVLTSGIKRKLKIYPRWGEKHICRKKYMGKIC